MTPRFSIQSGLGLILLAYALTVHAQEQSTDGTDDAARVASGPVLLELLEFIGEFTTEDGEWVDPEALLEVEDGELVGATRIETPVLGVTGNVAGEVQPAAPVENCIATRCE